MKRTLFSVYRSGSTVPAVLLTPAWLTIYARSAGAPAVIARGGVTAGVTGEVMCARSADVRVGDVLVQAVTLRSFSVVQIYNQPASVRALISEILPPIPDEFESGVVEQWWVRNNPGSSAFAVLTSGKLNLTVGPSATYPSGGASLQQAVLGDFDFWAKVQTDAGGGAAIRYALIGCLDAGPPSGGVYVGLRNDGTAKFARIDETTLGTITETVSVATPAGALNGYVRFKRVGKFFHTYYSLSLTEPATSQEWVEIAAPGSPYTDLGESDVGLFGYQSTGTGGAMYWEFLRNWN